MMRTCYLSIGANLGNKRKNLRQAVELISQIDGVELLRVSHFYETAPWGVENQPDFINAAVKIKTNLQPLDLLNALQAIEYQLGRVRHEHWGARTIDIDILSIDGVEMDTERIKLPHPYMLERDFVLVPLSEVSGTKYPLHGDKVVLSDGCLVDFNLKLLACVDNNFGIGYNGQLLFHINEDLKHFRELTLYNTVIMGRKTFESISKPLDNRRNIILSRNLQHVEGVEIANNLEELYQLINFSSSGARSKEQVTSNPQFHIPHSTVLINSAFRIPNSELIYIIGGGEVYRQLLPYAAKIYLTIVRESKEADTYFPNLNEYADFICDDVEQHEGFEFRHYLLKP